MQRRGPRWVVALLASVMLGLFVVGSFGGSTEAQTPPVPDLSDVCGKVGAEIGAADLPASVNPDACDLTGVVVSDNGVGAEVPKPGMGVSVEALTTTGAQELEIVRREDGTVEFEHVGNEADAERASSLDFAARGPNECRDRAFSQRNTRVDGTLVYYYNQASTPGELSRRAAQGAVIRGGNNVTRTRNTCRLGDRVPANLAFGGNTRALANVNNRGRCAGDDGQSVVSFGTLPGSRRSATLAIECTRFTIGPGYDPVQSSDIKVNKARAEWTTNPGARNCRNKYDLESVITHERGHTFGLNHVSEGRHGNLTMSVLINGPCQSSERTLGRGDVLGLDRKY